MITAPVIHKLGGPPSREQRTGHVSFVLELLGRPGLPAGVGPLVQPLAIVAAEEIVGAGDAPVSQTRPLPLRSGAMWLLEDAAEAARLVRVLLERPDGGAAMERLSFAADLGPGEDDG